MATQRTRPGRPRTAGRSRRFSLGRARPPARLMGAEGARPAAAAIVRRSKTSRKTRTLDPHGGRGQGEGGFAGRAPLEPPSHPNPLRPQGRRGRALRRAVAADAAGRACDRGLPQPRPQPEAPSAGVSARRARPRGAGHGRRPRPSAGRAPARDRRDRTDPAASGQRQRRRLHHHRGRDRGRQSDPVAADPRTLSPRGVGCDLAALHRQIAARRERHPYRRRPAGGPDPAAQHLARAQWRRRAAGKAAERNLLATTRATSSCAAAISASGRALARPRWRALRRWRRGRARRPARFRDGRHGRAPIPRRHRGAPPPLRAAATDRYS